MKKVDNMRELNLNFRKKFEKFDKRIKEFIFLFWANRWQQVCSDRKINFGVRDRKTYKIVYACDICPLRNICYILDEIITDRIDELKEEIFSDNNLRKQFGNALKLIESLYQRKSEKKR